MSGPVAVALSRDVPASTSIGVRVHDVEYVVWRDANGKAHIWEDRCPHRGMKLSLGFVRGDRIACLYHGWEYGTHGGCLKIPAHPDLPVPDSITVDVFGAAEGSGLIWLVPEGEGVDDHQLYPVRSMLVEAQVSDMDAPEGVQVYAQPASDAHTMLHILVSDGAKAEEAFHWSQRLRTELENAP